MKTPAQRAKALLEHLFDDYEGWPEWWEEDIASAIAAAERDAPASPSPPEPLPGSGVREEELLRQIEELTEARDLWKEMYAEQDKVKWQWHESYLRERKRADVAEAAPLRCTSAGGAVVTRREAAFPGEPETIGDLMSTNATSDESARGARLTTTRLVART